MAGGTDEQATARAPRPTITERSGADERQRAVESQELVASAMRLKTLAQWAMALWPSFLVIDWIQTTYVEPASFWWFAGWRMSFMPVLAIIVWRLRRPPVPGAGTVRAMDFAISTLSCASLGMMCLRSGGLTSHYAAGLLCVLAGRGLFLPLHWRAGTAVNAAASATYPAILIGAAFTDAEIAAQFRSSAALGNAAFYMGIILAVAILSVVGGHTHWALRRQVFEARHIGRYRLKEPLGAGGMGEVWAAWHTGLKRDVALKILRPDIQQTTAVQRFEREVAATADLSHPNTVRVFDYGVTEDGLWYYAMERLEGETLRQLVASAGPLPPGRVVHLVAQAARALAEAHGKGIVHRDIKPDNLFVTTAGGEPDFIKVLDFGIAALIKPGDGGSITTTGAIPGTPAYMAPEVISGQRGSPASDVYALGAVMYFALTGTPPFEAENWASAMMAHVQKPPVLPSERRGAALPAALEDLVMRCLAKDPAQRPVDAGALAAELADLDTLSWSTSRESA